jgi:MEMO1 family protein
MITSGRQLLLEAWSIEGKEVGAVKILEHRSGKWSPELSPSEQMTLFKIAETTLTWCVEGGRKGFDFGRYELSGKLLRPTATFVTLKIGTRLRGCIGTLQATDPLYESVHENTMLAALRDTRFMPVRPDELAAIDIHISLLSPVRDIASLEDFHLAEHGIILEKNGHRAVYLPEVAPEQGWDVQETLTSLSQKAGLSGNAWREGARFSVFSSVMLEKT